jgi:hypothetical protein
MDLEVLPQIGAAGNKSEIRIPKSDPALAGPKPEYRSHPQRIVVRTSDFEFLSDFGPRISDLISFAFICGF